MAVRSGRASGRGLGTAGPVALGGAAGVLCGSWVMDTVTALTGVPGGRGTSSTGPGWSDLALPALPLLVVNVLGSFLLGLLWAVSRRRGPGWRPRLVAGLGTGFLGAFTTISSAVGLLVWPLRLGVPVLDGGAFLAAVASALGPAMLVLAVMAALSTAAAVLGLQAGRARPGREGATSAPAGADA